MERDIESTIHHGFADMLLRPKINTQQQPEELVKRLNLKPDYTILELGSDSGYYSIELARSIHKGNLILVDMPTNALYSKGTP